MIPSYLISGLVAFLIVWAGVGSLTGLMDDGLSWFSILIVVLASFSGIGAAALIAPKHKLIIAVLFSLVTLCLVPRPYTLQTSGDGESIPSTYELIGVTLGGLGATAVVFLRATRAQKTPSS